MHSYIDLLGPHQVIYAHANKTYQYYFQGLSYNYAAKEVPQLENIQTGKYSHSFAGCRLPIQLIEQKNSYTKGVIYKSA